MPPGCERLDYEQRSGVLSSAAHSIGQPSESSKVPENANVRVCRPVFATEAGHPCLMVTPAMSTSTLSVREPRRPSPTVTLGLALVALATILFEVLLTRIFSLTMWYHFAFMAVSVAMFGMTVGANIVFLKPSVFPDGDLSARLGQCALGLALSLPLTVLAHIYAPFADRTGSALALAYTFLLTALPFVFSGVFVCLALTRFPSHVGWLYSADLIGAALGCVSVIVVLQVLDGMSAVFVCGALTALAASLLFDRSFHSWRRASHVTFALYLIVIVAAAEYLRRHEVSAFQVRWAKGLEQHRPLVERWNSFSRIAVVQPGPEQPLAWSLGRGFTGQIDVRRFWLLIDGWAGTPLFEYRGELAALEFLKWDLTNFVHHLVADAKVLIVGAGGGKDILGAKLFNQRHITAVELNRDIMSVVNGRYGDFTGHLDRDPTVELVHDEARSYLERQADRYDVVQLSFIDTFAATAAGAFVLSENSLYTVEAWKTFLEHLTDRGILAVSRGMNRPEVYRLVGLAHESLASIGSDDPARHIVVIGNFGTRRPESWGDMALVLVSRQRFDEDTLARIEELSARAGFKLLFKPGWAADPNFEALAAGERPTEFETRFPLTLEPPTDNKPFFFNMLRLRDWFRLRGAVPDEFVNQKAVGVLVDLLVVVSVLTLLCIMLPLYARRHEVSRAGAASLLGFFAAIGLGFMLIEVATMQRLIIFLGHPVFGLTVILFALLGASGVGAALSTRVTDANLRIGGAWRLLGCLGVLTACGLVSPWLMAALFDQSTVGRIAAASLLLGVMGVFMGMAFPFGMRAARGSAIRLAPWLWGVNGATSVMASVLAVVIAMDFGISAAYWTGVVCYGAAFVMFLATTREATGGDIKRAMTDPFVTHCQVEEISVETGPRHLSFNPTKDASNGYGFRV